MSYKSSPPPPTGTSYGDTELTDDGWSQHSGPPKFTNYTQGNMGGQATQPGFNQGLGGRYATENIQQLNQNQIQQPPTNVVSLTSSMTQDDILFMRKFRKDCFLYRVLPIAATGWGSLYLYNKSKQLPHTVGRYVIIGTTSLFVGIASYRGQFRRMVQETRLNTPYMQALRRSLDIQPLDDDFAGGFSTDYGNRIADSPTNWGAAELSEDTRYGQKPGIRSPGQIMNPDGSYQSFDSSNPDSPKPAATYEELRARNRGYSR